METSGYVCGSVLGESVRVESNRWEYKLQGRVGVVTAAARLMVEFPGAEPWVDVTIGSTVWAFKPWELSGAPEQAPQEAKKSKSNKGAR